MFTLVNGKIANDMGTEVRVILVSSLLSVLLSKLTPINVVC